MSTAYERWLKMNPPNTWMTILKATGKYRCDICGDKPHEAFTYVPDESKLISARRGLLGLYGVCKDCMRSIPDWKKRIERKLHAELTGSELIDVASIEPAKEESDMYFIVSTDGPKRYFHPTGAIVQGEVPPYELRPDPVGAAVFRRQNAENLLKALGAATEANGDGKISKYLTIEHVTIHKKLN